MIIPNIWENKKWQPNHQPEFQYISLHGFTYNVIVLDHLALTYYWILPGYICQYELHLINNSWQYQSL